MDLSTNVGSFPPIAVSTEFDSSRTQISLSFGGERSAPVAPIGKEITVPLRTNKNGEEHKIIRHAGVNYVNVNEKLLNLPQKKAASKLGMKASTLSKRWQEASRGRKWPYRLVSKLDKEIMTILHNIPPDENHKMPKNVSDDLQKLLVQRKKELCPVVIRV
eukprot:CAMPEP_0168508854 /NCGR_PEP_ID=MMETSP0405-20121227/386_1 /TAXON_ID=498012 /ORGANISM="Trichosphaerium sp, Strain Am-I-7 wt" /LENGTH=160 /DNA_ID=CAMNT_0008526117 /DNA_START=90 /DNA_END=572 /DNA_ORIENTATION=+